MNIKLNAEPEMTTDYTDDTDGSKKSVKSVSSVVKNHRDFILN